MNYISFFFKNDFSPELDLENVVGIFYILIIILVISIIVAAFEVLYKARADARKSKVIIILKKNLVISLLFLNGNGQSQ